MLEANQNWEKCLKTVKKNISFQAYQTWFESLSVVNSDDEQITLQVPNRFHYEWVDSKYGDLMRSAIKKHFGVGLKINYSILMQQEEAPSSRVQKVDKLIPRPFHRASQLNSRYIFSNFIAQ